MKFIIKGGKTLNGAIDLRGFKNSATPIIAATVLTDKTCVLNNMPRVGDVFKLLEILKSMGSKQRWISEHSVEIKNDELEPEKIDQNSLNQIRSSILLLGPLLARFHKFKFITPGGCKIGSRPIDTHLESLKDLGASIELDSQTGIYNAELRELKSREVCLEEFSVTATENLLMLGFAHSFAIKLAAIEPHVFDLIDFLRKLGMAIETGNAHSFKVGPGKSENSKIEHSIINDPIEAGTFAILAAATKSRIDINGIGENNLTSTLRKLKEFGVDYKIANNALMIDGAKSVLRASKVQTMPYPGLPTDLQALFGVLATQASGSSIIFDTLYESRLKYIDELKKMGADVAVLDSHRAMITGPTILRGAKIDSLDLRAGATLIIAGLIAEGKTELGNIEQIDRGYEDIDGRLRELGADIRRV